MKKSIILSAALMVAMSLTACHKADKVAIEFSKLPEAAQTFVQTHFADKQVSVVYCDQDVADKDYEVIFTDGANVDFTRKGNWNEVEDRDADGVPVAIIPAAIIEYIASKHAGQYVVQIGKDGKRYEVELNNTIEMVFDKNGNFLRYDD